MPQPNDTICAIATATGGAIAIIRISGSNTFSILSKVFSKPIEDARPYTLHHGVISDHEGKVIDDVLVSIFRSPHSYTGEDSAEISFHGSPYIAQQILSCLTQQGCRQANPGEFTQRAYLNGKLDLSQAEAVADLIASTNRATHQIAMSQLKGHFSSELKKLRDQLLQLTSLLELELDFSDHEDLEFADRTELLELAQKIDTRIQQLAQSFETGQALKNGIPVAIIGAPNVGKSTLLNALLGEERAIVSDIQGTTRDTIEDTLQIDGITFRFIDTAGIRHTTDHIESLGIGRTLTAAQRATIILMVTEPGIPYPNVPIRNDQTVIRIENKTETFQAKYGIGLDKLRTQLATAAPQTSDTDIIVTNTRHYDALLRAHQSLLHVLNGLHQQLPGDLLSEDLRQILDILAEITGGQITPQETLNNIFSHFCVGK
ncbi:MAG: tRNA uridine-5-carboxymethylaminomethyl(34) synthesis GTPase MnmE [Bacteroidaceae bacterium]|nr:tRNA uridine-5-carboxymethylaminomethyl(34) synthesis GTPase MnmE [Bacteroidaceae bacterium]